MQTFSRTDQGALSERSEALPNPDLSRTWSTAFLDLVSPVGRVKPPPIGDLGSGWGEKISVLHKDNQLSVERVFYVPREMQEMITYRYSLDGSKSEQKIQLGRTGYNPVSTTSWEGNRLVITTNYPFEDPKSGKRLQAKTTQTIWLQATGGPPFNPTLVVETTREGVLGGVTTTNRTIYTKGYR